MTQTPVSWRGVSDDVLEARPPDVPAELAAEIARSAFGVEGEATPLDGERDRNFRIDADGRLVRPQGRQPGRRGGHRGDAGARDGACAHGRPRAADRPPAPHGRRPADGLGHDRRRRTRGSARRVHRRHRPPTRPGEPHHPPLDRSLRRSPRPGARGVLPPTRAPRLALERGPPAGARDQARPPRRPTAAARRALPRPLRRRRRAGARLRLVRRRSTATSTPATSSLPATIASASPASSTSETSSTRER